MKFNEKSNLYTGWAILINPLEYLKNFALS